VTGEPERVPANVRAFAEILTSSLNGVSSLRRIRPGGPGFSTPPTSPIYLAGGRRRRLTSARGPS